jgi:prepilin-type N-terminal cleavage/methylation domain-containing protein
MTAQRRQTSAGFTLIEMLIVVVIIGILATLGVARFNLVKQRGQVAAVQSDLRNLVVAQERYHMDHITYTNDLDQLDFQLTSGVDVDITVATVNGWAATGAHLGDGSIACGVFIGTATAADAPPATVADAVTCTY